MSATGKSRIKGVNKGDLNSFIFFLLLATLLWGLTKFSKEYASDVTTTITYLNVPEGTMVKDKSDQQVSLNLEASGFEFMFYRLKTPKVVIDLSKINPDSNNNWTISKLDFEDLASQSFNHKVTAKIPESGLRLGLDALGKRTVPVRSALVFNLQKGYALVDSLIFEPDSITFIGPKNDLLELEVALTESKTFNQVDKDQSGTVKIQMPEGLEQITTVPENIIYSLQVDEFVEAELLIPITLINAPEDANIKLFPSSIKVKYIINFKDYKSVTADSFSIICDFSQVAAGSNIVIPELNQQPKQARQVSLATSQVEFIFIQ